MIREAIAGTGRLEGLTPSSSTHDLDLRLAGEILDRIESGGDFWADMFEPFSRNDISRETVRFAIEKARAKAGKSMPAVARYLKVLRMGWRRRRSSSGSCFASRTFCIRR